MRLLIVGTLAGQLTTATKLAMDRGATVTHAADIAQALAVLRAERGADLLMLESRSPFANWKTPCIAPC
jgi:two-component system, response regulator FlrC